LREVIINALVHSDYSQRGAPIRVVFLDDRIEVESMGILLPGLTIEEMKQGTSRIRNPVIARVFKELHLIEQWGTGVHRIFAEARDLGLSEPKIEEIGLRLRFTVYLAKPHRIPTGEKKTRSSAQVEAQVDWHILQACAKTPLSSAEIASALGHKTLSGNVRRALPALRDAGLLEYTIPDKPNSRLQKYRLTEKGRKALEEAR
jgi:ATP-dependent DNA helicase RecG